MSEFEAAWEYNTWWQSLWHCFLSGRVPRMAMIMSMVEDMQAKGGVWFATAGEIATHVRKLIDAGDYKPRIQTFPIKDGRLPDIPMPPYG